MKLEPLKSKTQYTFADLERVFQDWLNSVNPAHVLLKLDAPKEVIESAKTTEDFLYKFLTEWNNKYKTLLKKNGDFFTNTFRRRSLIETFHLIQSYYPNYTIREFFADLLCVIARVPVEYPRSKQEVPAWIRISCCPDILRYVILVFGSTCEYYPIEKCQLTPTADCFPIQFFLRDAYGQDSKYIDATDCDILEACLKQNEVIKDLVGDRIKLKF